MIFFVFKILLIFGFIYGVYTFIAARNNEKKNKQQTKENETNDQTNDWSDF